MAHRAGRASLLAAAASLAVVLLAGRPGRVGAAAGDAVAWFQATEQELMSSIGRGDRTPWERVTDPAYAMTSEDGEVLSRQQLLEELRPLPPGLSGEIAVRELSVQEFPAFAVVRFLADERADLFGQSLRTRYRVTDTFRRDGKAWKLVASQLTVVSADPPGQEVSTASWPGLAGTYRLRPDGWTVVVELREGRLHGGRDPAKLRPLVPLAPNVFVQEGRPGVWIFIAGEAGRPGRLIDYRKYAPLVFTRVEPGPAGR